MGALKNVGEVVGAITDVVIDALAEPDYETGRPEPAEKHGFVVEEPKVNDFGRLLVWYHCGIRNTGSVCKNCGEYRRDRTVLDDPESTAAATYENWICPECGAPAMGPTCGKCGQPYRPTSRQSAQSAPSLRTRIHSWFSARPIARSILMLSLTLLLALAILLFYLWDTGKL
ncbi:MAG: hypothetical protein II553_02665 [Lachnospiraceae bacterium]|nr:hypothetical protein [Lachnospiraceae bacterium]MBQ2557898.1 hypothetical protein [Lachnospiraceae bacterium]